MEQIELHAIYCPCERCEGHRARRKRDERLERYRLGEEMARETEQNDAEITG